MQGLKRALVVILVLVVLAVGARYTLTAIPAYRATSPAEPPAARVWMRAASEPGRPAAAKFAVHDEFEGERVGWGWEIDLTDDVRVRYVAGTTVAFDWMKGFRNADIEEEARYFTTGVTRVSGLDTWWECQRRAD